MSLYDDKQADVIDNFNTSSRYFDDILNIHNFYFDNMVSQIYPCMWHELTSVPCVRVVKTLVLLHGCLVGPSLLGKKYQNHTIWLEC